MNQSMILYIRPWSYMQIKYSIRPIYVALFLFSSFWSVPENNITFPYLKILCLELIPYPNELIYKNTNIYSLF